MVLCLLKRPALLLSELSQVQAEFTEKEFLGLSHP